MSKINFHSRMLPKAVALLVGLCMSNICVSQTIDEIAEAQRNKILNEISAVNGAKSPTATPSITPVAKAVKSPTLKLHSIYKVAGKVTAEVTDGANLVTVEKGMKFGSYNIVAIGVDGVTLGPLPNCKRACPKQKLVRVGGVL